jgi:hypothetical protein
MEKLFKKIVGSSECKPNGKGIVRRTSQKILRKVKGKNFHVLLNINDSQCLEIVSRWVKLRIIIRVRFSIHTGQLETFTSAAPVDNSVLTKQSGNERNSHIVKKMKKIVN